MVNLKTDEPIKVVLGDETAAQGLVTPGDPGKVKVKAEQVAGAGHGGPCQREDYQSQATYDNQGESQCGGQFYDGNTDTQDIYADGEFIARTDQNRFTIGGLYKRSENEQCQNR